MNGSPLTDNDLELHARSYIPPDLARQARLVRVDSAEGAATVGRNGKADYSGIIYSYIWPGSDSPHEYRLRRDNPDLEQRSGGIIKERNKYLSPPGRGNRFYIPPGTPPEHLTDKGIRIVFVEGEKKALAVFRYFQERGERVLIIGLPGVWGWRGVVGKTADAKGARCDVKGPIPDFDRIEWEDRHALIIYDKNVTTDDSVRAARSGLAKELRARGANVRTVDLPQLEGVSYNGIDDLLFLKGPEFVSELLEQSEESAEAGRRSQATVLVELAARAELFHTPEGEAYATIEINGHRETWPLRSRGFRDWLMRHYYETNRAVPSAQAMQDALGVLSGKARFEGSEQEVNTRIAGYEGAIYLDLCDESWRVVQVTAQGWEVTYDAPVKFRRSKGMLPLPEPARNGQIDALRSLLNVTDEDLPLVLTWLAAGYRPGKPFPVLALHGEQGSAKSTTARILCNLIDPNKASLRSEPRDERDLMIAATNRWLVALDNLSRVPTWLSDALCRLATGGGFATRELYADSDEVLFDAMRPVLLNGIEELATRSDLLDRAIVLNLPSIPEEKRRSEADVWREFEASRPSILGALLNAVSYALGNLQNVKLERLPRMADFALWATAAEEALGLDPGAFMAAYTGNREAANDIALEASPVAAAVIAFVEREKLWTGRATDLLKELNTFAGDEAQKQQGWPKRGNVLSGALKRLAPNLRAAGIEYSRHRAGRKGSRQLRLEQKGNSSSASSASSLWQGNLANSHVPADDAPFG